MRVARCGGVGSGEVTIIEKIGAKYE